MTFAQLEYFLAIARTKKFCQAAELAYVSQSSLSKQIKALEEELGVELFVRSPSGAELTPAGETFLGFASKAVGELANVQLQLERYNPGAHLRVRVGSLPLMVEYDLHSALSAFQTENLSTQIDLFEREQANLIRRLDLNQIDVAFLRVDRLPHDMYEWIPLIRDEVVVVCSNQHRLSRAHRVELCDLKDERFVMLDRQSAIHQVFVEECHAAGFAPNITFTHTRHQPLMSAVVRNLGISVLPRGLTHVKGEESLTCIPFTVPIFTEIGLVHLKDRELTPWAEKLVAYFREAYPEPVTP